MKKVLLVAMCVLTLFCLCACQNNVYSQMNEAVSAEYSTIEIDVKAVKGSDTLTSSVTVNNQDGISIVTYHVEKFTEISADRIPTDYITSYEGVVEIDGGVVTSQTGDKVPGVSFVDATKINYNFEKDNFYAGAKAEDGVFTASVLNTKLFTGNNSFSGTDMSVTFDYKSAKKVLTVSYVEGRVSIQITYKMS